VALLSLAGVASVRNLVNGVRAKWGLANALEHDKTALANVRAALQSQDLSAARRALESKVLALPPSVRAQAEAALDQSSPTGRARSMAAIAGSEAPAPNRNAAGVVGSFAKWAGHCCRTSDLCAQCCQMPSSPAALTGPPPALKIMGIVNATPDSFSGCNDNPVNVGRAMIDDGADIIDIGGESTRPGAVPVSPEEERARVIPVIQALANRGVPISIDTRNAATMAAALDAGASIVNDVTGLTHDAGAAPLVAARSCGVVLMHMRGTPQTMATLATYDDVVAEVVAELSARIEAALAAGVRRERIWIDPGIGFAKAAEQNLILLQRLEAFVALGLPVLVGVSRKSFIGRFGGEADPLKRGPGSLSAALFAVSRGASILRVHDVAETVQALRLWQALAI
jgi:dihydropteroate synthase